MFNHMDPTIFDSLNARQLTPKQVAESFIPPDSFYKLIERNNHIIIGPRGSGKTTLLKMLQLPALANWDHPDADEITKKIDFVAAFIPTDRAWENQWLLLDRISFEHKNDVVEIKKGIFLTHTIHQILDAFYYRSSSEIKEHQNLSRFFINIDKNLEADISSQIAKFLKLKLEIPSLKELIFSLRERLSEIGQFTHKHVRRTNVVVPESLDYIYLPFIQTISNVISVLNSIENQKEQKWAFLFDELEIAPKDVRTDLFTLLRSTSDQSLLFKLSMSPFSTDINLKDITSAQERQDFISVNLSYSRKDHAQQFCEKFFAQMCKAYGLENIQPNEIFGVSEFDKGNEKTFKKSAYGPDSILYERFKSLANKDKSFQQYLDNKNVNLETLDEMSESDRASKIRKVTTIVCLRNYFLGQNQHFSTKRSTKLYTGVKTIFDVTEGNPRLFISLIGPLLKHYHKTRTIVPESMQANALEVAVDRFLSLLNNIPDNGQSSESSVMGLVDTIGEFFQQKLLKEEFLADPPTKFVVDKNVSDSIIKTIGDAINAGALIYVHKTDDTPLLDSIVGKTFRVSYLLAPHYKLPTVLYKHVELSKILMNNGMNQQTGKIETEKPSRKKVAKKNLQASLFDFNEDE